MEDYSYATYIMASLSGTLYIGVTNDIFHRAFEHKHGVGGIFTAKYKCHKLVYWEEYDDIVVAIAREKVLKKWLRSKKEALIRTKNPGWHDLAVSWPDPFEGMSDAEVRAKYKRR